MSQYSTLKRRPVLFPASAADFSKNLFAMKEEIKALIADDPANKAEYAQAAVEVAIDLQSALTDWVLTKLVDKADCKAASEDLLAFAADVGADAAAIDAAKAEIASIADSSIRKMCDMYREGTLNTVWGHDYASGLDHSLRRGARWVTSNPCKIQNFKGARVWSPGRSTPPWWRRSSARTPASPLP